MIKNVGIPSKRKIPFEHERRFVPDLKNLPFDFTQFPMTLIAQWYLEDKRRRRVRDEYTEGKHKFLVTTKSGQGISRREDEREISRQSFDRLIKGVGCFLVKSRYFISHGGIDFQLNIFHGKLIGPPQIEIEFKSKKKGVAFIPPTYFGPEVTDDGRHSNYSIAKYGMPKD